MACNRIISAESRSAGGRRRAGCFQARPARRTTAFGRFRRRRNACVCLCSDRSSTLDQKVWKSGGEEAAAAAGDDASRQHGGQTDQTTSRERRGVKVTSQNPPKCRQHRDSTASHAHVNIHCPLTSFVSGWCVFSGRVCFPIGRKSVAFLQMVRSDGQDGCLLLHHLMEKRPQTHIFTSKTEKSAGKVHLECILKSKTDDCEEKDAE